MENCKFCEIYSEKKFDFENELAFAFWDANPVSKGHIIFMTKRHIENFFETTEEEKRNLFELIDKTKNIIDEKYKPTGYNIGINCGVSAGQTVMHVHVHLIPRYDGDVKNPKGGVRGVIPEKRDYTR